MLMCNIENSILAIFLYKTKKNWVTPPTRNSEVHAGDQGQVFPVVQEQTEAHGSGRLHLHVARVPPWWDTGDAPRGGELGIV